VLDATGATDVFGLSSGALVALEATRTLSTIRHVAAFEPPSSDRAPCPLPLRNRPRRRARHADHRHEAHRPRPADHRTPSPTRPGGRHARCSRPRGPPETRALPPPTAELARALPTISPSSRNSRTSRTSAPSPPKPCCSAPATARHPFDGHWTPLPPCSQRPSGSNWPVSATPRPGAPIAAATPRWWPPPCAASLTPRAEFSGGVSSMIRLGRRPSPVRRSSRTGRSRRAGPAADRLCHDRIWGTEV
jgi:hypothetical protein